jgi:hypothetical protein
VEKTETNVFDKQIEEDIKSLKRSSRLLAILGISAFVLLLALIVFAIYDKSSTPKLTSFIDIAFVNAPNAALLEKPEEQSRILASLKKGDPVLQIERQGKWVKVQKKNMIGWMPENILQSKAEHRAETRERETPIVISDVDWVVDEQDHFTVVGKVKNQSDLSIREVEIKISFSNKAGKVVAAKSIVVSSQQPMLRGDQVPFNLKGDYSKDFGYITTQVVRWK